MLGFLPSEKNVHNFASKPIPMKILSAALLLPGLGFAALVGRAVNVQDYGARGDGVADDTPAIVAAVNGARDGLVEFPRGSYRITRTIEIKLSVAGTLGLAGRGGSGRIIMAGEGPAFRFIGSHTTSADPAGVKEITWERERMPMVAALEIVGENPLADGIEVKNTMQPVLRGVLIRGVRHALRFTHLNRNVLVEGCHIYNCSGIGIYLDAVNIHQMNISGSHISYCLKGGIKIVESEIRNLQITGNDIEYNEDPKGPPSAEIWIDCAQRGSVSEGAIVSNTIQGTNYPGGANIRFTGLIGPDKNRNAYPDRVGLFSITGNHISTQEVNIHLDHVRGVSITGNTFIRGYSQNLLLESCRNLVISGNVFDHNEHYHQDNPKAAGGVTIQGGRSIIFSDNIVDGAESGSLSSGGALAIADSREITVSGCQILNPKFRGIYVNRSANVRVNNCTITEENSVRRMLAAVEFAGSAPGSIVSGNSLVPGKNGDVVAAGSGVLLEGNHPVFLGTIP